MDTDVRWLPLQAAASLGARVVGDRGGPGHP